MVKRRRLIAIILGALGPTLPGGRKSAWAAPSVPERPTYFLLAFSDPIAGQEEAYERWFSEPHLRDMGALPGITSVQHYTDARVELRRAPTKTPRDLVLYTIETSQPDQVADAIKRRAQAGEAWPGPSIASLRTVTYRAMEPRMKGVGSEPAEAKPGNPETYLVLAFLDAVAGQDQAFNTWYDTIHEPELLANRGVVSGQRSALSDVQMAPTDITSHYLMQVSIVTSDLPAVFREMIAGGPPPPALDRTRGYGFTYRAVPSRA